MLFIGLVVCFVVVVAVCLVIIGYACMIWGWLWVLCCILQVGCCCFGLVDVAVCLRVVVGLLVVLLLVDCGGVWYC